MVTRLKQASHLLVATAVSKYVESKAQDFDH